MLIELGCGFLFLAGFGFYQFWQHYTTAVIEEPQPEITTPETLTILESLSQGFSELDVQILFTNWFAICFWVVSTAAATWAGIIQPVLVRWNYRKREDIHLTDLIPEESTPLREDSRGSKRFYIGNDEYRSESELRQADERYMENYREYVEPDMTQDLESPKHGGFLQTEDQEVADACAHSFSIQKSRNLSVETCNIKSMNNDGYDSRKSFLSEISGREKEKVDRILNSKNENRGGNSFACEEESNFCASSCSRTRDQTPVSIGTRQESEPNRSCNYQSGSQWGTAKGSSFGDVQGMGPEAGSASWFTSSKIKSGKDNESLAESERSLGSSNGTNLLKPPSGSFSQRNDTLRISRIPMKRTTSLKRISAGNPGDSNRSTQSPKDFLPGQESNSMGRSVVRSSQMSVSSNCDSNSGRDSGLDGVLSKADSNDVSKDKVFSRNEYPYTASDESEVSVQSLLDQSEFSLLTSSPEAILPVGASRPRGRVSLSKSFAGKSIDEKFNSLLDVVMKHGDEINELFKENTRGRRNSQTEVKNSIQARNRAKSCPRIARNGVDNRRSGTGNTSSNEKVSSSSKSYSNGNYFTMYNNLPVTPNNLNRSLPQKNQNGRLKNPPMRFGNEDKTVFIAAGHYRPSDLEIIKQKGNLRHVEVNLSK